MGSHTKWGGYKIDYKKVRTYVVPEDLKSFTVGLGNVGGLEEYTTMLMVRFTAHAVRHPKREAALRHGSLQQRRGRPEEPGVLPAAVEGGQRQRLSC